jgi:hypothetical protein
MRNFENKEKIMRVSGVLRIVSTLVLCLYGSLLAILLLAGIAVMWNPRLIPNGPFGQLHFRLLYIPPWFAMALIEWWNFRIFFQRLNAGHIFDAPTVRRLAMASKWRLAAWIYSCATAVLFDPEFSPNWLALLGNLTGVLAIIFMAWLLREGQTLEEEQELTV